MSIPQSHIYLASQSPRRRELLKQIGVNFEVLLMRTDRLRGIDVDETPLTDELPETYARRVCQAKAEMGYNVVQLRGLPLAPVLAADTVVTLDGQIFGKPNDAAHATAMLRQLSGREHQVLSAIAVAQGNRLEVAVSVSTVRFTRLDDERIKRYLYTNEYADKAGGYGIQGYAAAFIEYLSGSYSGVMGLPLFETARLLQRFGCPTP
ncbi:MAG TPA: nucleoside triphosphate pyrophosphatase [Gallionella sp.]|nr:nucleoside triphosphate pyrophosphatase [Gallionella sp.]